ncbi:MAG: carboxypeptidase-like regulatory domain-containing protein [Prevotella sp.]|nr:carboxypeptidase-like regulatory domain-containing protein [Prevotella sp.]
MNRNKINELLRRYDEALTTDAEERELAEFFRSATDIPDEWADYAVLFNALDTTDSLFSDEEVAVAPKTARIVAHKKWLWAAAVAALVVVAGGGLLRLNQLTKENAELIAEIEPKATEIHQKTASEGSIFAQKIAQKPNDSISTQKATAKVEKEIEEKGDEKKEIIEVSGNVFSLTDKEPVVGATVMVVGTKIGAATDVNGNFSLQCQKGSLLKIFFVGMYPTVVEAQPSLNIALAPDDSALDEIIVVGYGTSKKSENTGSIRIRGTSAPTDDNGILVLINGEEWNDFFDWKIGTIDELKEILKKQNLIYEDLSIMKADAVAEKYRQKFGDWVKIVIEIMVHPIDQEGEIYEVVAQMPQFPGGEEALMEFVEKNLQCPQDVIRRGVHGQVVVSFIVGKNGKIQHPEAGKVFLKEKSGAPCSSPMIELLCRNEAVRIVKMMQNWNPGKNEKGEAVRVLLNIPIKFNE